jgi:sugar lactone lactonase YvrE
MRVMKPRIHAAVFFSFFAAAAARLETVADFGWEKQPTGIAASEFGRVFVSFPRWFDNFTGSSVVEVLPDGSTTPYPNQDLNSWSADDDASAAALKFVCIQSVFIDHFNRLWILDAGNPFLGTAIMNGVAPEIVSGAPKLVLLNLTTNAVVKTIPLALDVAPLNSYVNDVRITKDGTHAILSDSNMGGIKVVNIPSGDGRVLLADHPSTHSEDGALVTVEGQGMYLTSGDVAAFQSDGIAIIEDELYYHAVTAKSLYKISVDLLTDASKTTDEVEAGVTFVCYSGMPDGMVLAGDAELKGTLYMTAVEKDGVDYLSTDGLDRVLPFVSDSLLQWPDSLAANSKYLYITASQVNAAPFILDARPRRNTYQLYRVKLPASSA